jgi:hypothetical protein
LFLLCLLRKWGHVGPYHLQWQYCAFFFLTMSIVLRLLSRSRYCLVRFRPVDYCSSPVIVLPFLLFWRFLLFSRFGSTITCTSISRASAGSLYPSFGFNINLLSSPSVSLILLLLTLLVALIRHIGAWWCAITSPESAHHYHQEAQTQTLGEAPRDPSLEPGPSRAVTVLNQVLLELCLMCLILRLSMLRTTKHTLSKFWVFLMLQILFSRLIPTFSHPDWVPYNYISNDSDSTHSDSLWLFTMSHFNSCWLLPA